MRVILKNDLGPDRQIDLPDARRTDLLADWLAWWLASQPDQSAIPVRLTLEIW